MSASVREVLLVTHTGRSAATASATALTLRLKAAGINVFAPADEADELNLEGLRPASEASAIELVVVLGGDGTILRGAELARPQVRRCSASTWDGLGSSPRQKNRTSSTSLKPS